MAKRLIYQTSIERKDVFKITKDGFKGAFINSKDKKKLLDHFDTCPEVLDATENRV
jgi:hypothetical protein